MPFAPADKQGVIDLILSIQRDEYGMAITVADQPDLNAIDTFYLTGDGGFWVARDQGRVVGTIALRDIGHRQGALRKMFVASDYRGRSTGVAQQLLDALLTRCRHHGITGIFLGTTDHFVAAQRFYERNGFAAIAADDLPDTFPRMAVDTRFYTKSP